MTEPLKPDPNPRPTSYRATLPDGSRQTIYLPPTSSYLYTQTDGISSQFEHMMFYTVLKPTRDVDAHGRPIYDLAEQVAYDDVFMATLAPGTPQGDAMRAHMPFAATVYDHVFSKPDHGYIPVSEIAAGQHAGLCLINASYVIFHEQHFSQAEPLLCAYAPKGSEHMVIAGPFVAGEAELATIHQHYFAASKSDPLAADCALYGLYIDSDDFGQDCEHFEQSKAEVGTLLDLKPLRTAELLPMEIIPHQDLGFEGQGVILRDNSGLRHMIRTYAWRDAEENDPILALVCFGKVRPPETDMRIMFLGPDTHSIGITKLGAEKAPHLFSPMLRHITQRLLDVGTWPERERTLGQKLVDRLRRITGYTRG